MEWLQENLFAIVSTLFGSTSLVGYWSERNKRKIAEKKETSDALKSMQEAYDIFTKDALEKYNEVRRDVDTLKEALLEVTEKFEFEKEKNRDLEYQNNALKQQIEISGKKS